MAFSCKTEEISSGVNFTSIKDDKFKTNSVYVKFITQLNDETAADFALAAELLAAANSEYPTQTELSYKLSVLYGSYIDSDSGKLGDNQVLTINAGCIDDRYTIGGEQVTDELVSLFLKCIFSPCINNNEFEHSLFKQKKQELLDEIDSEINNKRGYAIIKANTFVFSGEPSSITANGSKEKALKTTEKLAYDAYKKLLKTAQVEIMFIGCGDSSATKEKFKNAFSSVEREVISCSYKALSLLKDTVCEKSEVLDVNQCKLVMALKSSSDDIFAIKLMNTIFGTTPFSKLFMNVREKLSLCYYCASNFNECKGTLLIDSGVEKENVEKARNEILKQLDDIKNGIFTDENISDSVLSITDGLRAVGDTPDSLCTWYFTKIRKNQVTSPDEDAEIYRAVTRERIIAAAKSFELDTVYLVEAMQQ